MNNTPTTPETTSPDDGELIYHMLSEQVKEAADRMASLRRKVTHAYYRGFLDLADVQQLIRMMDGRKTVPHAATAYRFLAEHRSEVSA